MAILLFPDNTVLINFALISRMDLLERLTGGNSAWCATVAQECRTSATYDGLAALGEAPRIFGAPLFPDTAELQDTRVLREELANPGESQTMHLGEAETLAIMLRRRVDGLFVTDDREAQRLATTNGVRVATTWGLLKAAYRSLRAVDADTLWGYVQTLRSNQRGTPPGVYDRPSFNKWLGS
ncbi:hypothetical protein [Rhodococcus zopfii]|uniref:hypothetical protein n=1 Tax=Rhodococcus zopfii TaxID=43772 RepID=UPI000934B977|nr:hypothetical protein [Rhodococcus zopfii]